MTSQCDLCAYYWIDEEDGTGECQVNLDEDDLVLQIVVRIFRCMMSIRLCGNRSRR